MISPAAVAIAWAPEPQTRLTVIAGTSTGMPPPTAAWRAGFILLPAWMTFPMTTVPTSSPPMAARSRQARIAVAPSSTAGVSLRVPL